MARQNYYELLGVDYRAERDEIKQAYQRQRARYKNDPAMQSEVREAWRVLGSPARRKSYDRAINVARLRQDRPPLQQPAKTDVPGARPFSGLREPAKTDVPGVRESSGLQGPAKTEIPGLQADLDDETQIRDESPPSLSRSTRQRGIILEIQSPGERSQNKKLLPGQYLIGRGKQCDVRLPDSTKYISRKHAQLRVERDVCSLRDEKSTNGTRLNGQVIKPIQWHPLKDGDKIEIEDYILIVRLNAEW